MLIPPRTFAREIDEIFIPSTGSSTSVGVRWRLCHHSPRISPPSTSSWRNRVARIVDLPLIQNVLVATLLLYRHLKATHLPLRPQIPTRRPAGILTEKPRSAGGRSDRYFAETLLNTISPCCGQTRSSSFSDVGGGWVGSSSGASFANCSQRSTEVMQISVSTQDTKMWFNTPVDMCEKVSTASDEDCLTEEGD